eukprot:TRINITY_DN170_c1_g2_i1.p1 TRINITY_DN170_c1_g2~~TRINITY_DN170_c1_g2_i1.p1  ORF type:complete len:415 (-),score=174.29 TRINITY_DN170_c1_g2_i1:82-1326(-)
MSEKYDLLIWGATGFTGRLVAEYLAEKNVSNLNWAIGGRSEERLKQIKEDCIQINPQCQKIGILIGDSGDQSSIDAVISKTRVVITTAGPFARYGTPVVDACIRFGTDYCDITGESQWVREIIDKYHDEAAKKKVRIVPFCGFDSIPSDLGSYMMVNHIKSKYNTQCTEVKYFLAKTKGGISGGTIESLFNLLESGNKNASKLRDPYFLNDKSQNRVNLPKQTEIILPKYDKDVKSWLAPFVMGPVNTRVVRRSNSITNNSYSEQFLYSEAIAAKNIFMAFIISFGMIIFFILIAIKFTRPIVRRLLPKPGSGPTKKQRDTGLFKIKLYAKTARLANGNTKTIRGTVKGVKDPGYGETSKMLAEAGLCLVFQKEELNQSNELLKGGILTPATAFGPILIQRLRNAGMTFKVSDD